MPRFLCGRFPSGDWPIRTAAGIVGFHDGMAEVSDPEVAAALREVPPVFQIVEDTPPEPEPEPVEADEPPTNADLRAWATEAGVACPAKGKIPQAVRDAYQAQTE